jgi:hypothetical protein
MKKLFLLFILAFGMSYLGWGQTTVFSDDFSTNTSATWTTSGAIGSSAWSVTRSGDDWGARRNTSPQQLEQTNDVGATVNVAGWVFSSVLLSSFSAPYNTTLSSNPGLLTWTFNFRTNRTSALAGFTGSTSYGMAMILVSTSNTPNNTGNGYAVVMGGGGNNTIALISFNNGLLGTKTTIIGFGGAPAALANYMSVKVTYNPTGNNWALYDRDDGNSAFADPASGTLTQIGSTTSNSTYTGTAMSYLGAYWQGSTVATQTTFFDNIKIKVNLPSLTIANNGSQPGAGNINQGSTKNILQTFTITEGNTAAATLNQVTVPLAGTYQSGDISASGIKLYANTSNDPGGATAISSQSSASSGSGETVTFGSLSYSIPQNTVRYFWVTADIYSSATLSRTINANSLAAGNFSFALGTPTGTVDAGGIQTIVSLIPTITLANGTVPVTTPSQGTNNVVLYRVDVTVATVSATLNSIQFTTAGGTPSYVASDLSNLKIWYHTDATFTNGTPVQIGTTKTTGLDPGIQLFSGLTQSFPIGTNYLFLTTDLPCASIVDNQISVNAISNSDLTFASGTPTGSGYTSGGTLTFQSATPVNATGTGATNSNAQSVLTWTNPTGCYDEIMIVAKATSSITGTPSGNGSAYTDNLVYGSGTAFDGGSVVYKGSTSSQTITGLTNGTIYYFKFFTRKGTNWSSGIETNATPTNVSAGDFRSAVITGNWSAAGSWETWNGSSWGAAAAAPTSASTGNNVTVRSGHTITLTSGGVACNGLTVESTGKLYANNSTNRYISVFGNMTCDGTIGNGSTLDGICFNIEGASCEITGSGAFDATRIRKASITSPASTTTNLTISKVINLRYGGTVLYNSISGSTFNVTVGSGFTVNCPGDGSTAGSVCINGTAGSSGDIGGTFTINGTLTVSGSLYLTTNATTKPASFIIGSTGIINTNTVTCTASGTAGHTFTINNGGKLNFNGSTADVWGSYSTTNNTYTFNSGSIVEYSYAGAQTIKQPTSYSNLTFSSSGTKTLGENVTVNNNLTINSGPILTVPSNMTLTVSGTTATNGGLVLKSPAGTGPTGSFLPTGTVTGSVTVERYIPQYTSGVDGWYFLSSPVSGQAISPNFVPGDNDDVYRWVETATSSPWINYKPISTPAFTTFNSGEGYLVAYQASATKTFTGSLNQSNIPLTNQSYTTGTPWSGWHLLGNPFSCAVLWNKTGGSWALSNVEAVAQIMNSGGSYTPLSADAPIPAMNGFMVRVYANNSLTIPLAARAHSGIDWMKSAEITQGKLMLTAASTENTTYVETIVQFNQEATPAFDMAYDGHFLSGIAAAPQLYSIVGDEHLCVNTLPQNAETHTVLLGFVKGSSDNYTMNVSGLESFNPLVSVFLEDTKASKTQDLRQSSIYSFSAAEGDNINRFLLHFGGTFAVNDLNKVNPIQIYAYNNTIYVANNGGQQVKGHVFIYNLMGQQLMQQELSDNKLTKLNFSGSTGYYLVKVITNENSYSGKVFLR